MASSFPGSFPLGKRAWERGWWHGWRSALVLASHHCGPGSIPALDICELSLFDVLFSATRVFLRVLWFSSLRKNQHGELSVLCVTKVKIRPHKLLALKHYHVHK
jgi:hypothetical protein